MSRDPAAVRPTFESLFAAVTGTAFGVAMRSATTRRTRKTWCRRRPCSPSGPSTRSRPGSNFRAWFFKILTNCYFSKRRREKSRPVTSDLDDTPDLYLYARSGQAGFPTQGPDPAAQLLEQLGTERMVAAIGRLPEEYRVVSTLYFMEDLSYEEIAQIVGCPVGTVRSRLHRGRKMLQKALWQVAEESGIVQPSRRQGAECDSPESDQLRRGVPPAGRLPRPAAHARGDAPDRGASRDLRRCAREFNFETSVLHGVKRKLRQLERARRACWPGFCRSSLRQTERSSPPPRLRSASISRGSTPTPRQKFIRQVGQAAPQRLQVDRGRAE